MTDLGSLGGFLSTAYGINASGQVVGSSITLSNGLGAFFYSGGTLLNLNSLLPTNSGWYLSRANAISDSGQIVGVGTINGRQHAFLLDIGAKSTWTISGRVTSAGANLAAVTLALTGSQTGSAMTSADGTYSFPSLTGGASYTVTPSLAGYTFTPASQTFSALTANQTADFATTPQVSVPTINSGGIGPLYSGATTIQPGSWISIYGSGLASGIATWNGDFPESLGGTSVTINGKPCFLWYVSPSQINLQAPDDTATGTVTVVVTTRNGTSTSTINLGPVSPSFSVLDGKHVTGIIPRTDGSGAFGGGGYDIVGPTGTSLGYRTVAAKAGDTVVLFGTGFGPTNPAVPAGKAFSGAAVTTNAVHLRINNLVLEPAFSGMTSAGLYQFNVQLPSGLGTGDVTLQATVAGVQTPPIVISLQ